MRLAAQLGVDLPVIQAPMAGAQDAALAIAVAQTGGLGSLPCAMLGVDAIRAEVARFRAASSAPFNLNFFCHQTPPADETIEARWRALLTPFYAEFGIDPWVIASGAGRMPFDEATAALVEELAPPIVSFHFGLPPPALLLRVRATGARVLSSATTVDEARWLADQGVDAVIAQGLEAGGHRGHFLDHDLTRQMGSFALLPQVVAAVRLPVIAAGGIADAAGVAAAFALGAAGVQVGTAYLRSNEATTSVLHRAALADERARHTALTNVFTGRPARGMVNRAMRELGPLCDDAPPFPRAAAALAPLRAAAEALGRSDFTPLWAGQNAAAARDESAAGITALLAAGLPRRD